MTALVQSAALHFICEVLKALAHANPPWMMSKFCDTAQNVCKKRLVTYSQVITVRSHHAVMLTLEVTWCLTCAAERGEGEGEDIRGCIIEDSP